MGTQPVSIALPAPLELGELGAGAKAAPLHPSGVGKVDTSVAFSLSSDPIFLIALSKSQNG